MASEKSAVRLTLEETPVAPVGQLPIARYTADAVQVLNVDGSIRYTSPATEWVSGYTPEEVVGTVSIEFIHPDDLGRVIAEFTEIWSRPGLSGVVRHRARHKLGHWLHLETTANNLLDDPEVQGWCSPSRTSPSASGRKRRSGTSNGIWSGASRNAPGSCGRPWRRPRTARACCARAWICSAPPSKRAAVDLVHLDLDGRWLRVNEKLLEIVGYSREELLRPTLLDIIHPDDREEDLDRMLRLRSGEMDGYSVDNRYGTKGGVQGWASLSVAALVRHPSGEPSYL
ncbi:MAG: PAS domain S-box protein [Actinomycetota bacterium]|nr:PAS domain S-box protein [Actinomycetota bacterium]